MTTTKHATTPRAAVRERLQQATVVPVGQHAVEFIATPGAILLQALSLAGVDDVALDFTAEHDSDGRRWRHLFPGRFLPDSNVLAVVRDLDNSPRANVRITDEGELVATVHASRRHRVPDEVLDPVGNR